MAPKSKQARHCSEIARNKSCRKVEPPPPLPQPNPKMDTKMMVVGGLLTGNGYQGMKKMANYLNTPTCSKRTYYLCQQKVVDEVIESVKDNCRKYAEKIKDNSCLSVDGRWNHSRNGSSATASFIDENQKKVVAFESSNKVKGLFGSDFIGSSKNMETNCIEKGLSTLRFNIENKHLYLAHDHDNTTSKLIKKHKGLNIEETLDPGHATLEIKRKANKHFDEAAHNMKNKNDQNRNTIKKCFELFSVLIVHIITWFKFIIYNVRNQDKKERMWLNLKNHVLGDHKECEHPNDLIEPKKRGRPRKYDQHINGFWEWDVAKNDQYMKDSLENFLKENKDLVRMTSVHKTQRNESLNAMIAQVTPKNKIFNKTKESRSAIAVGRMNEPNFDSNLIKDLCPNKLSPLILNEIEKDEQMNHQNSLVRNSFNKRKRKNKSRQKLRESHKKNDEGDYKKK